MCCAVIVEGRVRHWREVSHEVRARKKALATYKNATMTTDAVQKKAHSRRLSSLILLFPLVWLLLVFVISKTFLSARIYDAFILQMTSAWYHSVLTHAAANTVLLDVGIGTAGALLANRNILYDKHISIFGVDISPQYVEAAQRAVQNFNLQEQVQVARHSIYNVAHIEKWLNDNHQSTFVDSVYFSGSFSLLPDPLDALIAAQQLLRPGGTIYITQTYASSISRIGQLTKPLIRFLTTIDFGQLVSNEEAMRVFQECNLTIVSHTQLQQENAFGLSPPAFLTILRVPMEEETTCSDEACREQ